MGGNYIQTGFANPTNSVLGPDDKFIVSDPFPVIAAARLHNALNGLGTYIRTPFFEPSESVLVGDVYVVQDPIAAFKSAGFPAGAMAGLGYDPYSGYDPSEDIVPSASVIDPVSRLLVLDQNANLVPAGAVNPDGTINFGSFTGPPQSVLDILSQPVNTVSVPAVNPLTNMPIVQTVPGNWVYNQNTGVFDPGPGGTVGHGPAAQPSFTDWLAQPVSAGIPLSRGMALAGAAVVVFGMGLLKPSRRR